MSTKAPPEFLVLNSTKERNHFEPKVARELTIWRLKQNHEAHAETYQKSGFIVYDSRAQKWFAYQHMPWGRNYMGSFKGAGAQSRAVKFVQDLA